MTHLDQSHVSENILIFNNRFSTQQSGIMNLYKLVLPVTLLHHTYFLDYLLQISIDWHLFNGDNLT